MRINPVALAVLVPFILVSLMISGEQLVAQNAAEQTKARILIGPNVLVSRDRDGLSGELLVAADPTNPRNLLGAGIFFRITRPGQEGRGYYSRDGGYTWKTIVFPEGVTSSFTGDPVVAYGRTGTGYFVMLGNKGDKQFQLFYRSEDGGVTWGKPTYVTYADHEQIVVDLTDGRFGGNVYISGMMHFNEQPDRLDYHIGVFRSTDDGRTFTGPVSVVDNHDRPERGVQTQAPLLFTDGEIFLPFYDFPATGEARAKAVNDGPTWKYGFVTSNDGAATFSVPQNFKLEGGGEIIGTYNHSPFFAIDNSNGPFRDRIYMVWVDKSPGKWNKEKINPRLQISYSSNRGKTWLQPKMVSAGTPGTGGQYGDQSIAVNKYGTLAVSWYDTRDNPTDRIDDEFMRNRYLAVSVDGGETFLPAVRVSSATTDKRGNWRNPIGARVDGNYVRFLNGDSSSGEYLGLTADKEGTFHELWTDGRTGSNQIWAARIRVEQTDGTGTVPTTKIPELVEADVTDRVEGYSDPLREFPKEAGTVELPIRLKNKSQQPIYGPIKVEVVEMRSLSDFKPENAVPILNAGNGKGGVGAVFDYTVALGDFELLAPGAITEEVVWRFKTASGAQGYPLLKVKVTARVEPSK